MVSLSYLNVRPSVRQTGISHVWGGFSTFYTILPSNFSNLLDTTNVVIFKSDMS